MDTQTIILLVVVALIGLPIYLTPSIIAFRRRKANRIPIAILNVVAGWTGWGWVGTLLWACFDKAAK